MPMTHPVQLVKRALVIMHRWLGVAMCLLFLLWFPSGLVMMYWPFPEVSAADRLAHAPALDASLVALAPAAAFARLDLEQPPSSVRLNTFDGRPAYRFRAASESHLVFADTGEPDPSITPDLMRRVAARWAGQPAASAVAEQLTEVDQWTVQNYRSVAPAWKFSWPDGQQVYVSANTGEVVQATTRSTRTWAYLGAIPHWFYFTPLRRHGPEWSRVVIWTSAVGTATATLGLLVGVWMYSPSQRYRYAGLPTAIPYRGQKRLHTIVGLLFGVGAVTWAFSGMLSMEPFPLSRGGDADSPSLPQLLGPVQAAHADSDVRAVLARFPQGSVKELEFTSFAGAPMFLVTLTNAETRVVPLDGPPQPEFDRATIIDAVRREAGTSAISEVRVLDEYDRYYLDRTRQAPLPVIVATYSDPQHTRIYIDPKTARIVAGYRAGDWMERWLYHGLHSMNFPWLYKYRPLWDIVVITFMVGGTVLCVTSLILAWRVLGRKIRALSPAAGTTPVMSEDLIQ